MESQTQGRLVAVGASAGGVEALIDLLGVLPPDLSAPVLVVLHRPATGDSTLARVLTRAGGPPAHDAVEGEELEPGRVYVAPPDRHLLVWDGRVRTPRGPRENGYRPAIDPLFRSAALFYGPGAIGVVLTGARDDGAAGAAALSRRGGALIVQDPQEALQPSMPVHAIAADAPEHVVPLAQIPELVVRLLSQSAKLPAADVSDEETAELRSEIEYAALELDFGGRDEPRGELVPLSCPECGGSLWEAAEGTLRLRCRVGHAYSPDSMLEHQSQAIDAALWTAVRALEERSSLGARIARRLRGRGLDTRAETFEERARESERHAKVLRDVLGSRSGRDGPG